MQYWWVNQNKTYRQEIDGGYLWAPKSGVWHHEILTQIKPGDLVFSFKDTYISAIGVVQRSAQTMAKPDFGSHGENWSDIGWYVETEFVEIANQIKPSELMSVIKPLLPEKYSPIQPETGKGNQIYLTEISPKFADLLLQLSREDAKHIEEELAPLTDTDMDDAIEYEILAKGIQGDLEKVQLTKARRGQGIFRTNVRLIEHSCRLTGVTNIKHLRASHIKPWRDSTDQEKIDGNNGLLLSPHVDHLFDGGLISFENSGKLLISQNLNQEVLNKWNLPRTIDSPSLNSEQQFFMEYHRKFVYQP